MTTANASLTPLRDLYKMAARANGSLIECLDLDKLTDADIAAEVEHYERTRNGRMSLLKQDGRPADVYGSLRGAKSGGLVRGDGIAITCFGTNLERQSASAGGIESLLRNWGGGKRAGGMIARPVSAVRAESKPLDIDAELKSIRDRESVLLGLQLAAKEAAEASLNSLAEQVKEFFDIELSDLKTILQEANASDLASGMRAAKAYLA